MTALPLSPVAARVTVVLPSLNGASRGRTPTCSGGYLAEAIESVLAQTYRGFELVLVDDGSTDDTGAIFARYAAADARIRVVSQENRGLAAARNAGVRAGGGEYVAFLDDDDAWLPEKLAAQVAFLDDTRNASIALVGTAIALVDASGNVVGAQAHVVGAGAYRALFFENIVDAPSSVLVRRRVLEAVGLFGEDLRSAEDRDLWLRISRDHGIRSLPERLVRYRVHGERMTNDHDAIESHELEVLRRALAVAPEDVVRETHAIFATTYGRFAAKHFSLGNFARYRHFETLARREGGAGNGRWRWILSYTPGIVTGLRRWNTWWGDDVHGRTICREGAVVADGWERAGHDEKS